MRGLGLALALVGCSSDVVHDRLNVRSDGALLPVEVHGRIGSGTLVIFESGGPSGPGIAERDVGLLKFQDSLEDDVAVALYDRRGTGNATGDYGVVDQSIDQLVADLHAVRTVLEDRYQPDRIVLMGHSFGAYSSAVYLLDRPAVDAWIPVSPAVLRGVGDDLYVPWRRDFACRVDAEQLDAGATGSLWTDLAAFCEAHPSLEPVSGTPEVEELWGYLGSIETQLEPWPPMDPLGLLGAVFGSHYNLIDSQLRSNLISDAIVAEPGREDLLGPLTGLPIPTRVITGEFDGTTPTELGQALAEAVGGDADLVELRGGGHYPMADDPEAFGRAVRELVRTLD